MYICKLLESDAVKHFEYLRYNKFLWIFQYKNTSLVKKNI